ncbi:MAG: GIY-YIG nuclease family protein [Gemmatimonadaceae bacterium]|nr:GIY-YIG nuclease family protein [Gemmatimonadaceae bacterium]
MTGRSIRIFMPDGSPTGLRMAEVGMSTVKAVACSRTSLDQLDKRAEARRTGVYILVGLDPNIAGRTAIYVGEGDVVFDRIVSHDKDETKDFFERIILFVSKDENLTKAHVRWLEARLIQMAHAANRATVMNANGPTGGNLPEADAAEMSEFLVQAVLLAATLGLNAFEAASAAAVGSAPDAPSYEVQLKGEGYNATAVLAEGEVIVRKGSVARTYEAPSLNANSVALRAELKASGVLEVTPGGLLFKQDYAFGSPSGAAQVVYGASVNGWDAWKFASGKTLQSVRDGLTKTSPASQ